MPIAYDAIAALVSKYEGLTAAQRHSYKEANTRKDFIEPLFEALGWDVRNIERNEVEEEKHVRPGFADYAFKLDGIIRFYLEAKPLRENAYNEEYARQVITYAYNKGVTWAVLCNFCTLQVFNAEWETTDLNSARVLNLSCGEYATPDSPLELLSRDAFLSGELEKKAQTYGTMRPRLPVEKSLFAQLRRWRQTLFSQIANYRRDLTHDQVDEAVLRLLNRLIFIRNCEDRRIEEARLRAALREWEQHGHHPQLVEMLRQVFHDFDANYDSDLFNLALADQVFVEGMALEEIIRGLYQPPGSLAAYDFSVIDADVLGQVYEQYLGYVAREVKDKAEKQRALAGLGYGAVQVELEAKRQRRKERGIYYTPRWVVDYIARQTVGRYLEEHGYDDVMNVKILDPASGSGSFLIRAFDMLLDYHASIKGKSASELDRYERWRILTGNIYGVDVDPQAVEIARLNLLLRAVARRELLPTLAQNIRRGNSLISGDEKDMRSYFGRLWREKQPFDWQREFPDIMAGGGFDIVIGNPPYVRIQTLDRDEVRFYNDKYDAATGNYDIYCLFVERALQLLKPGGVLGFIIPNKFMQAAYGRGLRKLLADTKAVSRLVDFGDAQVFESGTNYTCLLFATTSPQGCVTYVPAAHYLRSRHEKPNIVEIDELAFASPPKSHEGPWVFPAPSQFTLLSRLESGSKLASITRGIFQGVITGADRVFILHLLSTDQARGIATVKSDATGRQHEIEQNILRPMVKGSRHVHRYQIDRPDLILLFPYAAEGDTARLLTKEEMSASYPKAWKYLAANRGRLENREGGKWRGQSWYGYSRIQNMFEFQKPKLLVPYMVDRVRAAYDGSGGLYMVNVTTGGYGIALNRPALYPFALAILNSTLAHFYLRQTATRHAGNYYGCTSATLGALPLPNVDIEDITSDKRHTRLVAVVQRMVDLHQRLAAKGTVQDNERTDIEREIARTDREIDDLVYDLYGLTAAERDLIEREMTR